MNGLKDAKERKHESSLSGAWGGNLSVTQKLRPIRDTVLILLFWYQIGGSFVTLVEMLSPTMTRQVFVPLRGSQTPEDVGRRVIEDLKFLFLSSSMVENE